MKKILIIAILILSFQTIFSQGINKEMEQNLWEYIHCKFVNASKTTTTIYAWTLPRDIAICLRGNVSREDSLCINELIAQLKTIIPKRKIYLTPGRVCLVFNFTNEQKIETPARVWGDIFFRNIFINLPNDISDDSRKKILYYNLYNSLVYSNVNNRDCISLEGCVFSEDDPMKITYSPYDSYILGKLYANDFLEQYKKEYLKNADSHSYLLKKYAGEYRWLLYDFGLLTVFVLLLVLLAKGAFNMRKRSWFEYNRIGLYLILIGFVGIYLLDFRSFWIIKSKQAYLISYFIRSIAAVNIIYLAEHYLYRKSVPGGLRLFLIILITFSAPYLVSIPDWDLTGFSSPNVGLISLFITGACLRAIYLFLNDHYRSMINKKDVQLAKIGELHKQVQLQSLQAKINPHFLYNALNSIASLATTDAKKTEQMALSLSDFFKYSINREQKQLNSLSEELNAVKTYLEIEKVRFGERLSFEIDCPEELLNVQIPQLLIQPLVENAIKHGLSQITENGLIRISISSEDKQLKIRIYDNGPAFPEGPLSGYGIQNTQERITLLYGGKASINWHNGEDKYIEISLPLEH